MTDLGPHWMILCIILPACAGLLILASQRREGQARLLALVTPPLLLAMIVSLYPTAISENPERLIFAQPFARLDFALTVEPLGWLFALIAGALWLPTSWYAVGYAKAQRLPNRPVFYAGFCFALASTMGIAFSANLLTLFVFYELLTLTTWPLVTHTGTDKARAGGNIYISYLLGSSLALFLPALIGIYTLTGSLEFTAGGLFNGRHDSIVMLLYALILYGVGKAALMPMHRWLPAAMVAPTPVSALLHAVAVVKAGVFTILKTTVFIFGMDTLREFSDIFIWLACISTVTAAAIALYCDDLKKRLAYSTISHLSYITLAATLATPAAIIGGGMHLVMHAFGKITLFFCAGAIILASGRKRVSELNGLGQYMPLTLAAFAIGSLSIIGLPPTGGVWSKWLLIGGALDRESYLPLLALATSSFLGLWYLLDIPVRGFLRPAPASLTAASVKQVPLICRIAIVSTALGSILLFFIPNTIYLLLLSVTRIG